LGIFLSSKIYQTLIDIFLRNKEEESYQKVRQEYEDWEKQKR